MSKSVNESGNDRSKHGNSAVFGDENVRNSTCSNYLVRKVGKAHSSAFAPAFADISGACSVLLGRLQDRNDAQVFACKMCNIKKKKGATALNIISP